MTRTSTILPLLPIALAAAFTVAPALAQAPGSVPGAGGNAAGSAGTGGAAAQSTTPAPAPAALPVDSVIAHRPRASQLVGATVHNDRGDTIGEVDDIILTPSAAALPDAGAPTVILQVGGFLGMGGHLVTVPLSELHWNAERERIVLPNATPELLKRRPAFSYDTLRRG